MTNVSDQEIVCIGCPMGCHVAVSIGVDGEIIGFSGNKCKEGEEYATQEFKFPVRVFTATVLTEGSAQPLLPVRTNKAIPKDRLRDCARFVSQVKVRPQLGIGEVIVPNVLGTGADLISGCPLLA